MNFVKLHQMGREVLVNLSLVSEAYPVVGRNKSDLYLNFFADEERVTIRVDESLDEIYAMMNGDGE